MSFVEHSWNVEYQHASITERAWLSAFKRLHWVQTIKGPSYATHVFQCKFTQDNKAMQEKIVHEARSITFGDPLKFRVATRAPTPETGPWQYHVVYDHVFRTSSKGFLLVLKTVDFLAKATIESRTRAVTGQTIDEMVKNVFSVHGLVFSDEAIEACRSIPHFNPILQKNMTDTQFLVNELLPRAMSKDGRGGYVLFTEDGRKAWFQTLTFGYPGSGSKLFKPDPLSLVDVKELEQGFQAGRLGGAIYTVHAFDPFLKKPYVVTAGPDVAPSVGRGSPLVTPSRYEYVPLQTQDAAMAWAKARQYSNRYDSNPMVAEFRGSLSLRLPMFIDFSGTGYREVLPSVAPVARILHLITAGRLRQWATVLKDKFE